jgi:hypothetical protein
MVKEIVIHLSYPEDEMETLPFRTSKETVIRLKVGIFLFFVENPNHSKQKNYTPSKKNIGDLVQILN